MSEPNEKDWMEARKLASTSSDMMEVNLAQEFADLRAEADARVKKKEQDVYAECKGIVMDYTGLTVDNILRNILERIKKAADKARGGVMILTGTMDNVARFRKGDVIIVGDKVRKVKRLDGPTMFLRELRWYEKWWQAIKSLWHRIWEAP